MGKFGNKLRKLKSSGLSIRGLIFFTFMYLVLAKFYFPYVLDPSTILNYILFIILGPIMIYLILRLIRWCVKLTGFDEIDAEDVTKILRKK